MKPHEFQSPELAQVLRRTVGYARSLLRDHRVGILHDTQAHQRAVEIRRALELHMPLLHRTLAQKRDIADAAASQAALQHRPTQWPENLEDVGRREVALARARANVLDADYHEQQAAYDDAKEQVLALTRLLHQIRARQRLSVLDLQLPPKWCFDEFLGELHAADGSLVAEDVTLDTAEEIAWGIVGISREQFEEVLRLAGGVYA